MARKMRADCLYERETTIIYNELEADCMVYTCNKKLQRAIERLGVKPDAKDHVGRRYHFPKAWLQPPAKPKKKASGKMSVKASGKRKEAKSNGKKSGRADGEKLHSNRKDGHTKGGKTSGKGRVPVHGSKGTGRGKDSVRQLMFNQTAFGLDHCTKRQKKFAQDIRKRICQELGAIDATKDQ